MADALHDSLQRTLGAGIRVDRELGGGGMSRVFLATDVSLDRQVAVKVLAPEMAAGVSADRFRREIQLVAKLQHPHIVSILSAGDADGALYYVMPFMSGESLRERLAREGKLSVRDAVRVWREMLDALSFAHAQGVVHRDIKPENILSGAGHAVIADFGVSKALQESGSQTTAGIALGTPAYMAPEQIAADPNTDQRADLYAAAVVAYEMLAGEPPFRGTPGQLMKAHLSETPRPIDAIRTEVPPALATLIMRALEKDPDKRPQTAGEMIAVLEVSLTQDAAGNAEALHANARVVNAARGTTRNVSTRMIAVSALVVAVAGAGLWSMRGSADSSETQSIAIAPFDVADGDTALIRLGQNLVTTVSANIDRVDSIHATDPMAMLSQAKQSGSMLTQAGAEKIARKVGARLMLYGTLTRVAEGVRAVASLRDINDPGKQYEEFDFTLSADSISVLTDSLTWSVLRAIWRKGTAPTPYASYLFTRSPKALREFLDGEQFFLRGGITEATAAYERAIAEDTTFWFAHYRYKIARDWMGFPMDTVITHRLARNLRKLPRREWTFLLARDSSGTLRERLDNLKRVLDSDSSYTPALLGYADLLSHHAMRVGYNAKDALPYWKRLAQLVPSDMESAAHVVWICAATGDLPCAKQASVRLDSLVRADSALQISQLQNAMFRFAFADRTLPRGAPAAAARDSLPEFMANFSLLMMGDVIAENSGFLSDYDRGQQRNMAKRPESARAALRIERQYTDAIRGSVASIDTALMDIDRVSPAGWSGPPLAATRQSLLRMRVLSELQGLLPPAASTAAAALSAANAPGIGKAVSTEFRWIAAASAMLRGDSAAYRERLAEFTRDTSRISRVAARSLRGIALGRSGNEIAAAESLLVLERFHADSLGTVFGAYGADRLLAADWLTRRSYASNDSALRNARLAAADSLLRFTEGYTITALSEVASAVYGAALLQRARIAEMVGDHAAARRFTSILLGTYDRPSPSAKALIDEAKARQKRLSPSDRAK